MVKNIMYGTEDFVSYFVQSSCAEEHFGADCDCVCLGSFLSEDKARIKAEEIAAKLMVPVIKC